MRAARGRGRGRGRACCFGASSCRREASGDRTRRRRRTHAPAASALPRPRDRGRAKCSGSWLAGEHGARVVVPCQAVFAWRRARHAFTGALGSLAGVLYTGGTAGMHWSWSRGWRACERGALRNHRRAEFSWGCAIPALSSGGLASSSAYFWHLGPSRV